MLMALLKDKKGASFVDACVMVLAIAMVLALVLKIMPVFIAKQQLDTFATEICRTAEIAGEVGSATSIKADKLRTQTGLNPTIQWSKTGNIQLNEEFTVIITTNVNIGLFGEFGSFPITLTSKATGASEVYHK
ncbi:uncharacterized protein DUF4320 [Desulfitobacterium sp. LBE]|nr:uncharacterized protein DUF4320 [Desulfitobacterium sp. LBE]